MDEGDGTGGNRLEPLVLQPVARRRASGPAPARRRRQSGLHLGDAGEAAMAAGSLNNPAGGERARRPGLPERVWGPGATGLAGPRRGGGASAVPQAGSASVSCSGPGRWKTRRRLDVQKHACQRVQSLESGDPWRRSSPLQCARRIHGHRRLAKAAISGFQRRWLPPRNRARSRARGVGCMRPLLLIPGRPHA